MVRFHRRWPMSPISFLRSAGSIRLFARASSQARSRTRTRRRARTQTDACAHATLPSAHPYVLLNYMGKPRDVMTLAHERGHGVHQVLAAPNGPLMAQTPLTLAETASVFGEVLTSRKLLAETTNKKQRKAMLAAKV